MHRPLAALLLTLASLAPGSCRESEPALPPRPAADITVAPGLGVIIEVSDAILFSGTAVSSGGAKPLFHGRLTARGGQALSAPGAPAGEGVRLRIAPAPNVGRGEEMTWIRAEGAITELPKTRDTAEFLYNGGEVTVRLGRDGAGKLEFSVVPAPTGLK